MYNRIPLMYLIDLKTVSATFKANLEHHAHKSQREKFIR